ncbi:hypothetical protein, partial [Rhizobium phaseoli]|uniref:hypothetical protein n=1 Tax=Rhizobium phaseoli TaxID=396 RepID=UPI001AEE3E10
HVLSLPPAFVLSQDQTLMLRIQSLAITSRSESTRTHTHHSAHHCAHNEVYSLDKRDRQSLFQRIQISSDPAKLRRPRFSFFQSSIVKKPTTKSRHQNPFQTRAQNTNQQSANPLEFL